MLGLPEEATNRPEQGPASDQGPKADQHGHYCALCGDWRGGVYWRVAGK